MKVPSVPQADIQSLMFTEAAASGGLVAAQRSANAATLAGLADAFRASRPKTILTLGRGSSDNALSLVRYLLERKLGIVTGSLAPSLSSIYNAALDMDGVMVLATSQSGRSPDLLASVRRSKRQGAQIVALVNDSTSPLALEADTFLQVGAGLEFSVAATKSFVLSVVALLDLVRAMADDGRIDHLLDGLGPQLDQAWELDWSAGIAPLAEASSLFVVARGHALGIAQEMALKLKETCGIHAEAISAAEVRHGPMALVEAGYPVLMLGQEDESKDDIVALGEEFLSRGAQVLHSGLGLANGVALPCLAADPLVSPLLQLQSFYRMCEALARSKGLNPDQPPHLNKVTRTL